VDCSTAPPSFGQRFAIYASRVRALQFEDMSHPSPPPMHHIMQRRGVGVTVLVAWFTTAGLFPRLCRVSNQPFYRHLAHGPLLASLARLPALQSWTLAVTTLGGVLPSPESAAALEHAAARIAHLAVVEDKPLASAEHAWVRVQSGMLAHAVHLRTFATTLPLGAQDLACLAALPCLEELRIQQLAGGAVRGGAFPRLRALRVADAFLPSSALHTMLAACTSRALEDLGVHASKYVSIDVGVLQVLAEFRHLRCVRLELTPETGEAGLELLRVLQCLPNLTHLATRHCSLATNAVVLDVVRACPRLIRWTLYNPQDACSVPHERGMPFVAFLDLLTAHPELRALPLMVSARALPSPAEQASFGKHAFGPTLTVDDIGDEDALVAAVRTLFPQVRRVLVASDGVHSGRTIDCRVAPGAEVPGDEAPMYP
jgi:hypothetical protein